MLGRTLVETAWDAWLGQIATIRCYVGEEDDTKGLEEATEACPRHRRQEFHEVLADSICSK